MTHSSHSGDPVWTGTRRPRFRRPSWFALAAVAATTLSMFGVSLVTTGVSQAAKLCRGTPVVGGELEGVTHNDTGSTMTRIHVQAGVGTGFFEPEPASHIAHGASNRWCVGSRFGIPAMQVTYRLSDGQEAFFDAYSPAVIGGLASGCNITAARSGNLHKFTCSTSEKGGGCIIGPGGTGGCIPGDVVFTVRRS